MGGWTAAKMMALAHLRLPAFSQLAPGSGTAHSERLSRSHPPPMRTPLLISALAGSLTLSAQSFPFPSSNATWVQYFEMMVTPPPFRSSRG